MKGDRIRSSKYTKKEKKKLRTSRKKSKVLSLVLAIIMMVSMVSIDVSAAEKGVEEKIEVLKMISLDNLNGGEVSNSNIKALLHNCLISVNSSSSGMRVTFMTDCVQVASTIGVKDVLIKQKVWYGWKTVATSVGGYNINETTYMGTIYYTNAIKGETYRITCTHYADADEYTEVNGELEFIFTY